MYILITVLTVLNERPTWSDIFYIFAFKVTVFVQLAIIRVQSDDFLSICILSNDLCPIWQ